MTTTNTFDPLNKSKQPLIKNVKTTKRVHLNYNNMVMQLRKICNHPYLMLEDMKPIDDELFFRDLICSSGKFCVLERLLNNLIPNGHKIIIFSQMTMTLNLIESLLSLKGKRKQRSSDVYTYIDLHIFKHTHYMHAQKSDLQDSMEEQTRTTETHNWPCSKVIVTTTKTAKWWTNTQYYYSLLERVV